jgi:hypothetical protein
MFDRTERTAAGRRIHGGTSSRPVVGWAWFPAAVCVVLLTAVSAWGSPASPGAGAALASRLMHPPDQIVGTTPAKVKGTTTTAKSTNWAGFAVSAKGVTFSDVVGSWVQPAASCPTNAQEDASFWVGIDGYAKGSTTVEQIGTDSDCDKGNKKLKTGGPHYYAWWEMYPGASNSITGSAGAASYPVTPGDSMTAQVSASGSSFTLTLSDASKGWVFNTTQSSSAAPHTSAEWIAEAPSGCNGCASVKLADFGSVTFSGLAVTASSTAFNDTQINMIKGKTEKAATTANSPSSLSVQWDHN